jgi:hypothetical protein
VINPETIKLPVWVIGVGLIHAAALALVLPMLITLPAPDSVEPKVETVDVELIPAAQTAPKIDKEVDQTAALPTQPEPASVEEAASEPADETPAAAVQPSEDAATKFAEEDAAKSAEEATRDSTDVVASEPAAEPATKPAEEAASEPAGESAGPQTDSARDASAAVANVAPEATTATPLEPDATLTAAPVEQAEPEIQAPRPKPAVVKKPKAGKSKVEAKGANAKAARPAPKKPAVASAKPAKPKPVYRRTSQDVAKKGLVPFKGSWSQLLGGPTPVPAKR